MTKIEKLFRTMTNPEPVVDSMKRSTFTCDPELAKHIGLKKGAKYIVYNRIKRHIIDVSEPFEMVSTDTGYKITVVTITCEDTSF